MMEIETKVCVDCDCHVARASDGRCMACGGEMSFKHIDAVTSPRPGLEQLVEDMREVGDEEEE